MLVPIIVEVIRLPAKSNILSPQSDVIKELSSRARNIRHKIEEAQDTPEIRQVRSKVNDALSVNWGGLEFADFCAQIITLSQFANQILQITNAGSLDFLDISKDLAKLPRIARELTNFHEILDPRAPPWRVLNTGGAEPEDIMTLFYEMFLSVYDKHTRDTLGTFYTPPPVVDFIVKSVDFLLSSRFGKLGGLIDAGVSVLDPASGTNVFLSRALRYHLKQKRSSSMNGPKSPREFLQNYETHEIQPAAYALGVFNVFSVLSSTWGAEIYNGIPWKCKMQDSLKQFGEEAHDGSKEVPMEFTTLVVWGNPPYKKDAKTESPILAKAMERYQDPVRFEKSLRVLSDYYVKFLRYAHEQVSRAEQGIIALVLNSSYIDGPVHRGLRKSLLEDFSDIYVLNLHGAIQPPEITPPGLTDENVFDIRTGVSILILVKDKNRTTPCQDVHYWDCWGTRDQKFEFLAKNGVDSVRWRTLPVNCWGITYNQFSLAGLPTTLIDTYARGISIRNIFKTMVMGVTTGKDQVLVAFTREELVQQIIENDQVLPLPGEMSEASIKKAIVPYNYRPLDFRYIFYAQGVVNRDRREVMQYLVGEQQIPSNIAIVTERFIRAAKAPQWNFIYATEIVPDKSCISNQDNSHVYPLFFGSVKGRQDNIRKEVVAFLAKEYGTSITSPQVFDYILALLSTLKFQTTFSPLIGLDYPVILFPRDSNLFVKMAEFGSQVKKAFLLREECRETFFHPVDASHIMRYNISEVRYDPREERLWYDPGEYVEIPRSAWNWYIGYFQPIEHYFSDRIGRTLTGEELANVNRAIVNVQKLTQVCQELDVAYEHIRDFLDCHSLLVTIIRDEFNSCRHLPIPGITPGAPEISRIRRSLYLPDERIVVEALEENGGKKTL